MMGNTTVTIERPVVKTLPPLQTEGRTREAKVEAQVTTLLQDTRTEFWRRARLRDRASDEWVQEETLVCLLRLWKRSGDAASAWEIAELLMERSSRFVAQQVSQWKLSSQHIDDCIRDVQMQMMQDLFNDSRGCEFWEVRFWLCLKRRLLNIVQKYRAISQSEFLPEPLEDGDGNTGDYFDTVAAPENHRTEDLSAAAQALAQLPDQARIAFVLYHQEEWPQQRIADHLNVTDRTVRNLLTRAEKILLQWRKENLH